MSQTTDSLDALVARFGIEETVQMLEFSQPIVRQWEQQLREAMQAGNWENATLCAHKAVSSVRMYGSPRLETLLCQIRDSDSSINTKELQQDLFAEFADVQQTINTWIAEHQ